MSSKYKIDNHQALHFITFATVHWVDALSRPLYKDVVVESLKYCQKEKGLLLYAWCIMSNHFHMIASTKEGYNLSDILRDFKKHISKRIMAEIEANPQESRKNWRVWIFQSAGKNNSNNKNHQFWQQDNHTIELSTNAMIDQRLHYIHMNSVKERIIDEPEHYVYSSAKDYSGGKGLIDVDFLYRGSFKLLIIIGFSYKLKPDEGFHLFLSLDTSNMLAPARGYDSPNIWGSL